MIRSVLSLSALPAPDIRDLVHRAARSMAEGPRRLQARAPVLVLSGAVRPYGRLAAEAGAALLGLGTSHYSATEIAACGDLAVAADAFGRAGPAVVLVGWGAEAATAFGSAVAVPCLGIDGALGCASGALADLLVLERSGGVSGHKLAIVGDASPRAMDLAMGVASLGGSVAFIHPVGFAPDPDRLTAIRERAAAMGGAVADTHELLDGLRDASVVQVQPMPEGAADRFRPHALARHALRVARPGVGLLHVAPERRGAEISSALLEEGAWWAPQARRLEPIAAASLLATILQRDPLRSVIG